MTWHGFRSLASTQSHELGGNDCWIETQLSHGDRNRVRSSYHHAKYLPHRRTMMQAWGDYLDSLRACTEITVSHEAGQSAALTATDAFQYVDSDRALSFQAQAMEALRAIISMSPRRVAPSCRLGATISTNYERQGVHASVKSIEERAEAVAAW